MPATLSSVAEQRREEYWNKFLSALEPWELHHLLNMRDPRNGDSVELFLHDEYVKGNLKLIDVRAMLAVKEAQVKQ